MTRPSAGFTLIELLVVVGLIALISVIALPSIGSFTRASMDSAARDIASVMKESYNSTVVTGRVYRIVYDIKAGQFWAEGGPPSLVLETKESKEKEAKRKRAASKDEKPPSNPFTMDRTITRNKLSLPRGVEFEDVITQESNDPIVEGEAATHLFPHGLIEQTIIHLQDSSNHHYSLVIQPVLGKTDVYQRYVTRKEIFETH